ncbi:MAG: TetR/AcrR family transcriptional regulator [Gemmatimonadota bacterium]|nr:MAG: TetR/AcrR family transcriptional regulator [Gemmatimonadota bacterium]
MEHIENPKLQQLVNTAQELFMRYGMRRVSIEEICRTAHVSKMTFYKHFSNKVDLTKFLINRIISESMARYRHIMDQDMPFPVKVEKTIEMKLSQARDVSQEYFHDMTQNPDPRIAEFIARKREEAFQEVLSDYLKAQKLGEIRRDINPEFILYFLNHIVEMISDERLVKLYDSPEKVIMELTKFFFFGILPRDGGNKSEAENEA